MKPAWVAVSCGTDAEVVGAAGSVVVGTAVCRDADWHPVNTMTTASTILPGMVCRIMRTIMADEPLRLSGVARP